MLLINLPRYAPLDFRDPDEAMRLVQVRDWLAGQSWFDVSQHRVNPPLGGPMHWSRIVDMPIAFLILLTRPLLGEGGAERVACIIVPLLQLAGLFSAFTLAARRVAGVRVARVGAALLALAITILVQFQPLRIDHHGWQIMLAACALAGAFDRRAGRGALIAGLSLALWLQISSEGLPYAILFGLLFALRWLREDAAWAGLFHYMAALSCGAALLLVGTKGWPEAGVPYCDALSSPFLLPLIAAAILLPLSRRLIGHAVWQRRLAVLMLSGAGAALAFLPTGRMCLAGPFEQLDPLVYRLWYLNVAEGRPIWEQGAMTACLILSGLFPGLIGTVAAALNSAGREERTRWLELGLLLTGAAAVAMLVMRAMSVAHLFALPGAAWLLLTLIARVQHSTQPIVRVGGTLGAIVLTPLGLAAMCSFVLPDKAEGDEAQPAAAACRTKGVEALSRLPTTTIFAPIDMGPDILLRTPHSVIGTPHHRNVAGIAAIIRGFLLPPDQAARAIGAGQATIIAYCPGMSELANDAKTRPDGLYARLERGQVPKWLTPVPAAYGMKLYRIDRQAVGPARNFSATPFMQ